MALTIKYLGEDINFTIKKRISVGVYRDLDAMANIFVYVSRGSRVVKFVKTIGTLTGYQELVKIDTETYLAQLTSANTTYLGVGDIEISQDFITSDLNLPDDRSNSKSGKNVFTLLKLPVSIEV